MNDDRIAHALNQVLSPRILEPAQDGVHGTLCTLSNGLFATRGAVRDALPRRGPCLDRGAEDEP